MLACHANWIKASDQNAEIALAQLSAERHRGRILDLCEKLGESIAGFFRFLAKILHGQGGQGSESRGHAGADSPMRQNIGDLLPYLVKVLTPAEKINGTGFFCHPDGFILTCQHVVKPWRAKPNEVLVVHQDCKLKATLLTDLSTEEGDVAVLRLDVSTEYKKWPFLPLDIHWRVKPEDKLQSFGYPQGKRWFARSGIPITAEVGGLTPTQVDKIKVYAITGLNLGNVDGGYSGAPAVNQTTQKVIGLIHAKHHEHQAFIVPLEPLLKRWVDLRNFHDIFRQIREHMANEAKNALQEKLKETEFIPLALEQGEIPKEESKTADLRLRTKIGGD
jgi:Trypsin-like peptidase domain